MMVCCLHQAELQHDKMLVLEGLYGDVSKTKPIRGIGQLPVTITLPPDLLAALMQVPMVATIFNNSFAAASKLEPPYRAHSGEIPTNIMQALLPALTEVCC